MKWVFLVAALIAVALLATRNVWLSPPRARPSPPPVASAGCGPADSFRPAADENRVTLTALHWAPFGVPEEGWDAYAPVVAAEIGTPCSSGSPGFAAALARWQGAHGLPASGRMDAGTFEKMRVIWMLRRPFVRETRDHHCPPGADEGALVTAGPDEGFWGKQVQLRGDALAAYRRLRDAARREAPGGPDPQLLRLVSGYRSPASNVERCAGGGCGGPARANCSAHQTGLAMDLYVGAAPGFDPTSSTDLNRTFQARTPIYQWLVKNAGRFGFVGYPYEPWHWEYAG